MTKRRVQPKRKITAVQQRFVKKTVIILVAISFIWVIFAPDAGIFSWYRKKTKLESLEAEIAALEKQNRTLGNDISEITSKPEVLEEVARKKYKLMQKNEIIYDFTKPKKEKKKE